MSLERLRYVNEDSEYTNLKDVGEKTFRYLTVPFRCVLCVCTCEYIPYFGTLYTGGPESRWEVPLPTKLGTEDSDEVGGSGYTKSQVHLPNRIVCVG